MDKSDVFWRLQGWELISFLAEWYHDLLGGVLLSGIHTIFHSCFHNVFVLLFQGIINSPDDCVDVINHVPDPSILQVIRPYHADLCGWNFVSRSD